jgi:molecular chaperone DnaK (HSP70)
MSKIVGIDLGTSTTCIAVVENGRPVVIPGVRGALVTPSYVHVMEGGKILIGELAKAEVIADPYNTIWATKRLIGRKFDDPSVQDCMEHLPYKISKAKSGDILVHGRDKKFLPLNVASLILKLAVRLGERYMEETVKSAVITVPASFNDPQRKATKKAAENIGLHVERLVNEPTASALAWGYHDQSERTVAVYDLGGGTFDVSILSIGQGIYEVLTTRGDSWLGGEDFDNRLVDFMVKKFQQQYDINIYNDKMAHQRVKTAAEAAKIELSANDSTKIFIEKICPDLHPVANVDYTVSRSQFEEMVEDLVDHTVETFKKTLDDAELDIDDMDNVILVGGMTRLPLVRKKIEELMGRQPDHSINPDEAVAMGAAIHAAALDGVEVDMLPPEAVRPRPKAASDVSAAEGVEESGAQFEAGSGAARAAPAADAGPGEWVGEAVAMPAPDGSEDTTAPAPAAESSQPMKTKAPLLIDVLSQSVGIADIAGLFVPLMERNTKLPARVSQVVTTCVDRQEAIRVTVYQGEERKAENQVSLGEFVLEGIEMAPRGVPQIQVAFSIDQSGLFTVSARDQKTGAEKEIRVEGASL